MVVVALGRTSPYIARIDIGLKHSKTAWCEVPHDHTLKENVVDGEVA
jgi:hypothetical protein